jgi:phospholipid/cholesterol/gamma-HCH transport system permease protein
MFLMSSFIGAAIVNFGYFLLRALGATDYTGAVIGIITPRIIAIVIFGYVFTAKVCCGYVADIGAMRVNEEIDAHESEGVEPMQYIIGTRLVAVLLYLPIASAVSLVGVVFGSWLNAVAVIHGVGSATFFQFNWVTQQPIDQLYCFISQAAIAIVTVAVACFYGMRTSGGPADVGAAVARSLAANLVLMHLIGGFFLFVFYGQELQLPIGG